MPDLDFNFSEGEGKASVASIDSFFETEPQETDVQEKDPIDIIVETPTPAKETPLIIENLEPDTITDGSDESTPPKKVVEKAGEINMDDIPDVDSDLDIDLDDDTLGLSDTSLDYKAVIEKLVEDKVFEGIGNFEVDGEEVAFEDMDIDEQTFYDIIKDNQSYLKEKTSEGKISVEGVSDFTHRLIEIEKNGGNVAQALESYQNIKSPLESIDLSTESGQHQAIAMKYRAKGLEDRDIISLIEGIKSKNNSKEEGEKAYNQLQAAFDNQMTAINTQAVERKTKQAQLLKTYRNDLGDRLKDFDLNDTARRKLLDIATKQDNTGQFQLDRLYDEARKDPNSAARLALFLTDEEEFIKQVTSLVDKNNKIDLMRKVRIVRKGTGKPSKTGTNKKSTSSGRGKTLDELVA